MFYCLSGQIWAGKHLEYISRIPIHEQKRDALPLLNRNRWKEDDFELRLMTQKSHLHSAWVSGPIWLIRSIFWPMRGFPKQLLTNGRPGLRSNVLISSVVIGGRHKASSGRELAKDPPRHPLVSQELASHKFDQIIEREGWENWLDFFLNNLISKIIFSRGSNIIREWG